MQLQTNQTMSSREIAELTGKEHRSVLRDIDKLNESYVNLGMHKIVQGYYLHENTGTQKHREMLLSEIQTMDLMTGYNLELRIKVNRRWKELEQKVTAIDFSNPETVLLLATNWKAEKDRADVLQIENNKLQTKGDIYDKVFKADVWLSGSEVCKTLGLPFGNITFYKHLKAKGVFYKNKNEPMQRFVDSGHIKLIQTFIDPKGVPVLKPVFAQKSLPGFAKMFGVVENRFTKIKTIK